MDFADTFRRVGELAIGAKARRQAENEEFLKLHRQIVETVPIEIVKAFGTLDNVALYDPKGKEATGGIELTVADHLWWKKLLAKGNRFRWGIQPVKDYMLEHLVKQIEDTTLEPEQRKALLALLDEGESA